MHSKNFLTTDSFHALYPFESRYHCINGRSCHYVDEGRGEPIVLLHGNPTWSFYYRGLIAALRTNYRLIAPDHIGCGLSEKPDDGDYAYRLESRVDDLEALLDELGITADITLVVHDWGGPIGIAYAARHVRRLSRLIILNSSVFPFPDRRALPWQLSFVRNSKIAAFFVRAFNAFSFTATFAASRKGLSADVKRAYRAPYDSWHNRIATLRFVQDIPIEPGDPSYALADGLADTLNELRNLPVLICWGERDFVFNSYFLACWQQALPQAEVHTFPEAGHYVLEDAAEQIEHLVTLFLRRHPL